MLVELGCIAAGVPLGFALRHKQGIVHVVDFLLTWSVRLLLLLLGLALGANSDLMAQLETLGLHATVISLCSIAGSLLMARWLGTILHVQGPGDTAGYKNAGHKNADPTLTSQNSAKHPEVATPKATEPTI